jgi:RNA polymerase sigma-70 factor (ECF subfamily)
VGAVVGPAGGGLGAPGQESCDFMGSGGVLAMNDATPVPAPSSGLNEATAFENLMRAYGDMVFSTSLRLVGNRAEAEDIAQEVFLRAYQHFSAVRLSPAVGGWLKTVATNLSLNHLQRYRKRWQFFTDWGRDRGGADGGQAVDFPAPEVFFEAIDAADRRAWVEGALQQLPAAQRVPLVLYHFQDFSYEEIAAKLGVSLSKVKTDIHRARSALARILGRPRDGSTLPASP